MLLSLLAHHGIGDGSSFGYVWLCLAMFGLLAHHGIGDGERPISRRLCPCRRAGGSVGEECWGRAAVVGCCGEWLEELIGLESYLKRRGQGCSSGRFSLPLVGPPTTCNGTRPDSLQIITRRGELLGVYHTGRVVDRADEE